ncbi:MAG TPA: hypothetical protein K8V84_17515 [Nocardiopsis listeri]|uniref:hypothetical protein n=1 Tax=Nocardiopsis listeri TaxID=53440 RepID=UPI001DF7ED1F|nr:hypothetical protein [Nocardiopsis listeri]HJE60284.1 hypothetical protein [Nocardiopsis listeri]
MEIVDFDLAMTTAVFGLFSFAWFGWAQERPPDDRVRWALGAGSLLALGLAAYGVVRVFGAQGEGVLADGDNLRTYLIVVGLEFALALAGAIVLRVVDRSEYTSAWICLVVGAHFFPLASLLNQPILHLVGVLLCVWPFLAVRGARRRDVSISFATGVGAGVCLLFFDAVLALTLLIDLG